jgi:hypothetical protein
MEILKKYIGTMQWSNFLKKWLTIERGKEELYQSIGLIHIFERKKPKLIKNVENTEGNIFQSDSNSNGTDNS